MRFYESLPKLTKAMILLTFVPFRSIVMYYWHFVISYHDQQKFSVCYHTVSPLGDIGKYFTIVKQEVIFPISQILTNNISSNNICYSRLCTGKASLMFYQIKCYELWFLKTFVLSTLVITTYVLSN
jgi:hypothetical protein